VDSGNTVTKSLVLSILGIVCCGIFTAPFGLYFGMKAKRENLPNGQVAFVMGWVSLVLSILQIIGSIIYFVAIAATIPSQL
jgi:K+ transporter